MTVLVLGHNGMLGNCVVKYFQLMNYSVITTDHRWPSGEFKSFISLFSGDAIVNCIAALPNNKNSEQDIISINYDLPLWLAGNAKSNIVFAGTDGEFSGNLDPGKFYVYEDESDAGDTYGKYKALLFKKLNLNNNVRFIRTSIIGIEKNRSFSLLSWFLSIKPGSEVSGFKNVLWNGITSLEWAKMSFKLLNDWNCVTSSLKKNDNLIQVGSEKISKLELLEKMNAIFNRNLIIKSKEKQPACNRCLFQYNKSESIVAQLTELKLFYGL